MSGKLVIGNWKMNTRGDSARQLAAALLADEKTNREGVGIAAPAVYLAALAEQLKGGNIALSSQDVSRFAADGAFTGEVSAAMLADVGCRYALVGHSERRQYFREDNAALLAKMRNAIAAGVVPVLCVGETLEQRESGAYLDVVREQLAILADIADGEYVVAYEPVWAIGTGKVASLEQIAEIHAFIKIGACKTFPAPIRFASSTAAVSKQRMPRRSWRRKTSAEHWSEGPLWTPVHSE
ncbi:Bifunctional PGK/TIM [Chromobacterium vaccinii]|nr:Bifunctional PGK/TIM [Chromobacterium vaccinii]